jgi:hypothetical protein
MLKPFKLLIILCFLYTSLLSHNTKYSSFFQKILNDHLQKLFEENARKSNYIIDSFSSNHPITESPTNIWCTTNYSTPIQQNLHSFSIASKNSSRSSNKEEHVKFQTVEVIIKNDMYEELFFIN